MVVSKIQSFSVGAAENRRLAPAARAAARALTAACEAAACEAATRADLVDLIVQTAGAHLP